jgi:hypothetical protein
LQRSKLHCNTLNGAATPLHPALKLSERTSSTR